MAISYTFHRRLHLELTTSFTDLRNLSKNVPNASVSQTVQHSYSDAGIVESRAPSLLYDTPITIYVQVRYSNDTKSILAHVSLVLAATNSRIYALNFLSSEKVYKSSLTYSRLPISPPRQTTDHYTTATTDTACSVEDQLCDAVPFLSSQSWKYAPRSSSCTCTYDSNACIFGRPCSLA
jgi:hypothetical protein